MQFSSYICSFRHICIQFSKIMKQMTRAAHTKLCQNPRIISADVTGILFVNVFTMAVLQHRIYSRIKNVLGEMVKRRVTETIHFNEYDNKLKEGELNFSIFVLLGQVYYCTCISRHYMKSGYVWKAEYKYVKEKRGQKKFSCIIINTLWVSSISFRT